MKGFMPWFIFSIVIVLALIAVAVLVYRKAKNRQRRPDYRLFFIIGLCWLPLGVALENLAFSGLGLVFMAIGLAHKQKWLPAKVLDQDQRKIMFLLAIITGLLVLMTFVIMMLKV